jgi:RNA polymerase sigma factor (sigma-70 family)
MRKGEAALPDIPGPQDSRLVFFKKLYAPAGFATVFIRETATAGDFGMARAPVGAILQYLRKLTASPADGETDRHLVRRFVAARDEAAFAAILRRHGGMVLGVCRGALRDAHEVEDAFQATFLVFVGKAGSLRRPELLGNWLYGVAQRVAAKARVGAARRRIREGPLVDAPAPESDVSPEKLELRRELNEAIGRLPDKYKAPVVLCYLEGKTYTEAARVLGWAEGTVSGRLSRARDMLRRRLERTAAPHSLGLLVPLSSEPLRIELVKSLTAAAVRTTAGQGMAGVSLRAAVLAKGVLKEMFWSKMKLALGVILMLGVAGAGVVAIGYGRAPAPDEAKPKAQKDAAPKVTMKAQDLDDVASILHIYKHSGEVQFSEPIKKAGLRLAYYKAGKLKQKSDGGLDDISATAWKPVAARFSLQAADLDYLPLAAGEKGSCRLQVNFRFVGADGRDIGGDSGSVDVRKSVFDFTQGGGSGTFPRDAGSATEVPLFYLLTNTHQDNGADTVAELLARNDKADILIVSLWTPK